MLKTDQVSEKIVQYQQPVVSKVITNDVNRNRLIYNSGVKPKEIEALFAQRTGKKCLSTSRLPTVYGQVIRASVKATQNSSNISKFVASEQSVGENSNHGSSHVTNLNTSPHNSTTVEVMTSGETLHTHRTPSNWEGSNECVSKASKFGTSHVQDSNPSPITSTTVAHAGNDGHSQIASLKVQDLNPGPLTNPTAEVMSSPRGGDPFPGGYTHQSGPRQKASIVKNGLAAEVIKQGEGGCMCRYYTGRVREKDQCELGYN